jgi:hypothetical protein
MLRAQSRSYEGVLKQMATVTAPQYVSAPAKSTMFLARRSDLRLVKTPRYPRYGMGGQKVGEEPGQAVQFRDGRLDVPEKGKMMLDDGREGDAGEIREWLLSHHALGNIEEGFWVVDQLAPPVSEADLDMLLENATDSGVLREIIRQEEQGWQRDALLRPARKQLEKVEEVDRQIAEERALAEAEAKKAK